VTKVIAVLACAIATQTPTFHTVVRTVVVHATVQGGDGRLVFDLGQDDFEVRDNGKSVQITHFSKEIQPITVALMLDMSASMTSKVLLVREATNHFIEALLPHDRVRIGSFGWPEIVVSPLLTGDKTILRRIVREETWPQGHTPLWGAIDAGMTSLAEETGRRVVLVLSDGADSGTTIEGYDVRPLVVLNRAAAEGFMIYAVRFQQPRLTSGNQAMQAFIDKSDQELVYMARETGGGHFVLAADADLSSTFARVAAELRHQYALGFTPAVLDGKMHRLDVDVRRSGLSVRARRSYVARDKR
jgi:Ca-activated chloride channel family protein